MAARMAVAEGRLPAATIPRGNRLPAVSGGKQIADPTAGPAVCGGKQRWRGELVSGD